MLNKPQPFGDDVISRISATMLDPGALDRLRTLAAKTLQGLAIEVAPEGAIEASFPPDELTRLVDLGGWR